MDLRIVYVEASGAVVILTPVQWGRFAKAITLDRKLVAIDPPQPFEKIAPLLRAGGPVVSWDDIERFSPEWAETAQEFAERIRDKDVPKDATDIRIVPVADIPADRTFRAAWTADLTVDMDKARDIQRDRLRDERAPMLAALDVEYQRADERGDDEAKAAVAAQKQALRDITKADEIEAAKTPDELKALNVEALFGA